MPGGDKLKRPENKELESIERINSDLDLVVIDSRDEEFNSYFAAKFNT